jgi:hypothetical protein
MKGPATMCHTGGPRCYEDAKGIFLRAQEAYNKNPTPQNEKELKKAKMEMLLTPEGIESVRVKRPEKANYMQKIYDHQLEGARDYERFRAESTRTIARLEEEQADSAKQIAAVTEKIQAVVRDMSNDEIDNENGDYNSMVPFEHQHEEDRHLYETLSAERVALTVKSELTKARINTINDANAANLERRKNRQPLQHPHLMPAKFDSYFADTERKHFNADSAGSTFTEAKNLNEEVLALASRQRKNLEGDDREKLIARGADPSSFDSSKRYLMVETKGKLGTVMASELNDSTMVSVVQKSEKTKPVCVVETNAKKDTDFATVVLVDNPTMPGTENHASLLITAFPGASGPSGSSNDLLPHVGKKISVGEAKKIFGRDFSINTILRKQNA